ncbi:hypothetical protein CMALT394_660004 [Carnobacterium maltaromaticum]|nr:hypothetical protein CMALT394_660004 [Carnobacterium maltaromaticum]
MIGKISLIKGIILSIILKFVVRKCYHEKKRQVLVSLYT